MMLAGLDVGGTYTDAVLLDPKKRLRLAAVKAPTRPDSVLPGIIEALEKLFEGRGIDSGKVRRLTVSSTLGLNALLTGNTEPVGVLALPGPGIDPALFWGPDPLFRILPGAQDHRGRVTAEPDARAVNDALLSLKKLGARALAVVCKFSPKNPELEKRLAAEARTEFGPDIPIVLGSECGGSLNFPRRLHTAWCNAALHATSREFVRALRDAARNLGLSCPVQVLKADAGSFSADAAARDTASTMGSGPAAGLLGVLAMAEWSGAASMRGEAARTDKIMLDMGGTSTDIALLAAGQPLLSDKGLTVNGRPTLIRTLWTKSIALGGDSSLRLEDGRPRVGPDRSGPALALCPDERDAEGRFSRPPTLTDALNTLGFTALGDAAISRAAFVRLINSDPAAARVGNGRPDTLAGLFLECAMARIREETRALLEEVGSRPVYTIRELLVDKKPAPENVVFIGGPAQSLRAELEKTLGLPVLAPEESPFANALGAALARPTKAAELHADTLLGRMTIADFNVEKQVSHDYRLDDATRDMAEAFARSFAPATGDAAAPQVQTVFAESFAVLDPSGRRGRILRVRSQYAPGLDLQDNP
ncbi:MAG: hydantoinase/oxoprolinase family protein [Desulfovibrio sp.]|jgi:N-methylhydantoinase A/oxoprolinase/acetone carboxylase beta subunit|nr:hydantoinase/oxoprolinase family protein [Desulfovibrio sp.]